MPSCEKCWADAYWRSRCNGKSQSENYTDLLKERADNPCTPKEQVGEYWDNEKQIDVRITDKWKKKYNIK